MTEANRKSQAERSDDASEVPRRGFRTAYRDFSEAVDLAELNLGPDVLLADVRDRSPGRSPDFALGSDGS
ncbi:MAG: hypothetical protein OXC28_08940 [Defluviicoccus sp.]|nr:hypothetical protein [Defluviicoccus sp.]